MMIIDDATRALHDKSTRGAPLSEEEQAQLEQWYAAHDAEHVILSSGAPSSALPELQTEVTAVLERCVTLAQRIQELVHDNDVLRRDVAQLRQQVARLLHPA